MICSIDNCTNKIYAKGLCNAHYIRKRNGVDMSKPIRAKHYHGASHTAMYKRWSGMIERCRNKNNPKYHNYGGRGIKVCKRWHNFANFLADVGNPPTSKHTLDRIDNDGDYEPRNVRWATPTEQSYNQRMDRRNTSGITGVHWDSSRSKWAAEFKCGNIRKRGRFNSKDEAIAARKQWETNNHI